MKYKNRKCARKFVTKTNQMSTNAGIHIFSCKNMDFSFCFSKYTMKETVKRTHNLFEFPKSLNTQYHLSHTNFDENKLNFLAGLCVCVSFKSHATQATDCTIGLSFEFIIKQHVENVAETKGKKRNNNARGTQNKQTVE